MTTATHNGTCQACGRQHAVNPKTGNLAKHGYTVDWGFFNGTCSGSDRAPLEIAAEHNIEIIVALRARAAELDAEAEGEIAKVPVEYYSDARDDKGRRIKVAKWLDRAEFEATRPSYEKFDREVGYLRSRLHNQARNFRSHAADLENLRITRHGQPLIARRIEAEIKRETFYTRIDACKRVRDLAAAGHKAQQRRDNWSNIYTVTYR